MLNAAEMFVDVSKEGDGTSTNWVAENDVLLALGANSMELLGCNHSCKSHASAHYFLLQLLLLPATKGIQQVDLPAGFSRWSSLDCWSL